MSAINDLDLGNWKESCQEIWTSSLWNIPKRDDSGAHCNGAAYHGNFVPQIPRQLIQRYTKAGELVIDPFLGGGTTLIECQRLVRNGIGIELNEEVGKQALDNIYVEPANGATSLIVSGQSAHCVDIKGCLGSMGWTSAQLVIMHPPYHDIIKFSEDDPNDLSHASDLGTFLQMFGQCVDNICQVLDRGRFLAVVCGDKYTKGEWVPLGFLVMQECVKRSYLLKSVIVKNVEGNEIGKGKDSNLWRYRALKGGYFTFGHEYIFVFRKEG